MRNALPNLLFAAWFAGLSAVAGAAEFRQIKPVAVPEHIPDGAIAIGRVNPVSDKTVRRAVEQLMAAWGKAELSEHISEKFYDKERLLDNISAFAPRDATIRILGVQSNQTVNQYILPSETDPNRATRVSKVVVTVSTAVEFTDRNGTFQSLNGLNEYTFEVKQRLRRR